MKVRTARLTGSALISAGLVALTVVATLLSGPAPAEAITRSQVMSRARTWIIWRIPYSQSRFFGGYRQDCSGFVSMSWSLGRSYTSRSISSRAFRVPVRSLRVGDAVHKPGHVSIFGGWKSRSRRTYWAYEQTTWGSFAMRRIRTVPSNGTALRLRGIQG